MRVVYDFLPWGAIPLIAHAKSISVHIWVPRKGWQRQERPRKAVSFSASRGEPQLYARNAYVPLFETSTSRFQRWLREHTREFDRGCVVVLVRDATPDWLHVGVYHDRRRRRCCPCPWQTEEMKRKYGYLPLVT
jgi:hypothetical protein